MIVKILLAPVLIFQGKQVRKNTPRLPEASGPRQGVHGNGNKEFSMLILGDSAAAGVGIKKQNDALSGQILNCFDNNYKITWQLIAKTGTTTTKTIDYLDSIPGSSFDIIVTSLGVNDVKANVRTDIWLKQQQKLIFLLRNKFKVKKLLISAVPPMELFPAIPWPLKWYLGWCAKQLNRALKAWLQDQSDCEFLEFNLPMDESLMAVDGFHPGPKLHTIWGKEIFKKISRIKFNAS